jgi:hypothetical protein
MTSALVIDSHCPENNIKYGVVEIRRVGAEFVGSFRFVEGYIRMRFGTLLKTVRPCYPGRTNTVGPLTYELNSFPRAGRNSSWS